MKEPVELSAALLDDGPGPARPLTAQRNAVLLGQLRAELQLEPEQQFVPKSVPESVGQRGAKVIPFRFPRRWASAGLLLVGTAAAAVGYQMAGPERATETTLPSGAQASERAKLGGLPASASETSKMESPPALNPAEAPMQPVALSAPPNPVEKVETEVQLLSGTSSKPRVRSAPPRELEAVTESKAATVNPVPSRERSAAAERAAADLLDKASRQRRAHQYEGALRTYERILREHPGSRQASVARVAAASLQMEHFGDPKAAARLYGAESGKGALSAEALYGLAEAKRQGGDRSGESAALRRLLSLHPRSALAPSARKRLEALSN